MKRDHLADSPFYVEYIGESFKSNTNHKLSYDSLQESIHSNCFEKYML